MSQNGQMAEQDREHIEQLARQALDDSLLDMDAATLSRLNQARQMALAEPRQVSLWRNWVPAGAAACALALAIVLPTGTQQLASGPEATPVSMPMLGDDISMAALEDPELLEDLDMMLWLLEVENHAS